MKLKEKLANMIYGDSHAAADTFLNSLTDVQKDLLRVAYDAVKEVKDLADVHEIDLADDNVAHVVGYRHPLQHIEESVEILSEEHAQAGFSGFVHYGD